MKTEYEKEQARQDKKYSKHLDQYHQAILIASARYNEMPERSEGFCNRVDLIARKKFKLNALAYSYDQEVFRDALDRFFAINKDE